MACVPNTPYLPESETSPTLLAIGQKMSDALAMLEALELAVTSPAINLTQRNPLSILAADARRRFEEVEADLEALRIADCQGEAS